MKKISLTAKIMLGMLLGILTGIGLSYMKDIPWVPEIALITVFHTGGQLFLNMFRMIVIPVVLVSMIKGVSTMNNPALLGRVGVKTLFLFAGTTILSALFGLYFSIFCKLGINTGITLPATQGTEEGTRKSIYEILSDIVPSNMFRSIVNENMLQVIFAAVIIGIALIMIAPRNRLVMHLLDEIDSVNIKIVELTLKIAPIGVFCLMAETFGHFGPSAILPLLKYIFCIIFCIGVLLFAVYPILLILFARLSPIIFYRKFWQVMLFAFSTSSSNATLPMNMTTCESAFGIDKGIGTFILSLGATINMNGTAIMQGCATVLIANLYNIDLSFFQIIEITFVCILTSVGTAGMPGAGVLMLGIILQSVGIPPEGTAIVMGVDRIVDMFRTTGNITGDAITALIVSNSEHALSHEVFQSNNLHSENVEQKII